MKPFTTDLKNQPGEWAHLCGVLAQRGVNLELSGVTAGDHGLVYFTASDEDAARAALEAAHIGFEDHPALQIKCADRAGEAARFARKLADAHVDITGLLSTSICGGEVISRQLSKPRRGRVVCQPTRSSDDPVLPVRCGAARSGVRAPHLTCLRATPGSAG